MTITGSILRHFNRLEFSTADRKHYTLNANFLTRLAVFIIGLPHLGFRLRARIILAEAIYDANKDTEVLDAGCGFGLNSMILAEKGFHVTAVDLDEKRTKSLADMKSSHIPLSHTLDVKTGSVTELPFPDESFDLTVCSEVIEHVLDHAKAVHELSRTLRKGGKLILTVPYFSAHNSRNYRNFGHVRSGYTEAELEKMLIREGVRICSIRRYEHFLGGLMFRMHSSLRSKVLLSLFFYPFYLIYLLDYLFPVGEPNQMIVIARKN